MWIGLNDIEAEGTWRWLNGNLASLDNATLWIPGQPDGNPDRNCAVISFFSYLADVEYLGENAPCDGNFFAICEKQG